MRTPYLVQRMTVYNDDSTGSMDDVFGMEYMGSAEFEFGALPASLKTMCRNLEQYNTFFFREIKNYENKMLCVIATNQEDADQISSFVTKLMQNEYSISLKEITYLSAQVKDCPHIDSKSTEYRRRTKAWWDIEGNVMFCFGKPMARRIINAISATKEKKKKQNAEGWF